MERKTRNISGNDQFDGVLLLLFGLILLIWPRSAVHLAVMVIGGGIVLYGISRCVTWFRSASSVRNPVDLAIGLALTALGIAMLVKAKFFAGILYLAVGALVAFGVLLIALKLLRMRGEDKKKMILPTVFGVLLLGLAITIFLNPSSLGNFILRLQGIGLLLEGASMLLVKPHS